VTDKELAEQIRKALEEFSRLPPEEQARRLVASGTIDVHGEVLMGSRATFNAEAEVVRGQERRSAEKQGKPNPTSTDPSSLTSD
jgi:hypothetical protein